jgi:hypothetical protein
MPGVLAAATFRKRCTCQIGQPEGIVEFSVCKQSSVRGDPTAVELQPQTAVEIDPDGAVIRLTRWVSHACTPVPMLRC